MRRVTYAGLLLCLLSITEAGFAQTAPPETDAGPTVQSPEQATAPTWEPATIDPSTPSPTPPPPTLPRDDERPPRDVGPPPATASQSPWNTAAAVARRDRWYGWQILIVDATALASGLGALGFRSPELAYFALGSYVLGGPIVQFANGYAVRGFASLGLRVLLPVAGAGLFGLAGASGGSSSYGVSSGAVSGVAFGAGLGVLTAVAIDAAMAREKAPDQQPALPQVSIAIDQRSAGLVASGMF